MLELDAALPASALCAAAPAATPLDAHWWHGSEATMQLSTATGAISRWDGHGMTPALMPTRSNEHQGQIGQVDDLTGLQLRLGTHCGFVAEDVIADASTATLAIRYFVPSGDTARTVMTLNTEDNDNYLFLSEQDGALTAKDNQSRAEVSVPCPPADAPRLAIVSLNGDRLALSLGAGADQTRADGQARTGILTGKASLYVGCRNSRPRLLKTLGEALILDVWLFAGRALLHSATREDRDALTVLARHHLWAST